MSLHGDIRVNGRSLGSWSAQRVNTHPTGRHQYRWHCTYRGQDYKGHLWHQYDDGAAVLASRVLTQIAKAARSGHTPAPVLDESRGGAG